MDPKKGLRDAPPHARRDIRSQCGWQAQNEVMGVVFRGVQTNPKTNMPLNLTADAKLCHDFLNLSLLVGRRKPVLFGVSEALAGVRRAETLVEDLEEFGGD